MTFRTYYWFLSGNFLTLDSMGVGLEKNFSHCSDHWAASEKEFENSNINGKFVRCLIKEEYKELEFLF
jgi:hypothetical protein